MWSGSGGEFGDVDPSPIPVGWGFDVVVSFAGRWSEGRFPPAYDDRLTGEECSWFGISDLIRSSPGDDLLSTGNGVSGSTSLTDVIVGLDGLATCVSCLDVRRGWSSTLANSPTWARKRWRRWEKWRRNVTVSSAIRCVSCSCERLYSLTQCRGFEGEDLMASLAIVLVRVVCPSRFFCQCAMV